MSTFSIPELNRKRWKMLPPNVRKILLSRQRLGEWSTWTLRERVHTLKEEFNIEIGRDSLRHFYKHHGVKFRSTQNVYRTVIARKNELDP